MQNGPEIDFKKYWTKTEASKYIEQAIKDADSKTLKKLEEVARLVELEKRWASAWKDKEQKLFNKFRGIVLKADTFFKVKHVDQLKLPYDILIFLAKKNVGKSCEIYRMIQDTINKGKKFIYMRLNKDELTKGADAFNSDSNSPVFMFLDKQTFKFYSKAYIREILHMKGEGGEEVQITPAWVRLNNIPSVGRGYEFTFCQSYTGGQFEDYETVFYDECLSYNPRSIVNERHLSNWAAFLSSIARNKENLKVYLFGNLLGTNNAILDFYGINADDNFRYIARGGDLENGCRILFINASDLYKGYEAQNRTARHAGGAYALKLEGNEYLKTTTQLIPTQAFDLFKPYALFKYDGCLFDLRVFELEDIDEQFNTIKKRHWACQAVIFRGYEKIKGRPIVTANKIDLLYFSNLKYVTNITRYLQIITLGMYKRTLRCLDEFTLEKCCEILINDPLEMELIPS